MSLKRMSMLEEVEYLKYADSVYSFLGNGSSRVVFSIGDGKCIKVASDVRGQYQNHVEIELFKKYGGDYLAEIYAYGKYIVVMDEVEPIDSDVEDIYNYSFEESIDEVANIMGYDKSIINNTIDTYNFLCRVLGETSDNFQIGLRDGFYPVAYDYGFESGSANLSVSDGIDIFMNSSFERNFLPIVIKRLMKRDRKIMEC